MTVTNYENFMVYTLLAGEDTALSYNFQAKQIINLGHKVIYAAAVQGRNNARAVFTGSLDMFSNEFLLNS